MKLKITIDEKESFHTHTDRTRHKLWEAVSLLHCPYRAEWKQRVVFEVEGQGDISIGLRHVQCMEFFVDFLNNV